jgi:hypothetical protein
VVPRAVLEVVRSAPPGWRFWFRLHPVNQSARRAEAERLLGQLGVDLGLLDFATETPLHALLRRMDCHLTVGLSTVITEAAAFGVPSVACGAEATEFFRSEADAGMLVVVGTAAEVRSAIERLLAAGRGAPRPESLRAADTLRRLLEGELTRAPHSAGPAG